MSELIFKKAEAPLGKCVRFTQEGDDTKSVYLGNTIEGEYVGKETDVGINSTTIYKLRLMKDETIMSVWGNVVLDDRFNRGYEGKEIPIGAIVRIHYLGNVNGKVGPSKQAGKGYHNYDVEYAIPATVYKTTSPAVAAPNVQPKASAGATDEPFTDSTADADQY